MLELKKKRLAIIGGGKTASAHIRAFLQAGLEFKHCAARPDSKNIIQFASRHRIENVWKNPEKLVLAHNEWDGILIATAIAPTLKLLKLAAASGKPVLVEKPVSTSSYLLSEYSLKSPKNVIVAYNRRHYSTIQAARDFVINRLKVRATMCLPENILSHPENKTRLIQENSVHGIDILSYIFGPLKIEYITTSSKYDRLFGRHIILRSSKGHLISLAMNWCAPDNFSLIIDDGEEQFSLIPFEKYQHYKGMDIIPPSDKYPVKQYVPRLISSGTVFDHTPIDLKPGFLSQSKEFYDLLNGKKFRVGANLTDAYNAQKLAENFLNIIK